MTTTVSLRMTWTLGTSALLACLVACSGGIAPVGGDGDGGGGGGGGGGDGGGGGGGSCTTSPLPLKRACVPATAKAGVEITIQADGDGCTGCGSTVEPCKVDVVGKSIRLSVDVKQCPLPDGLACPAVCGLPQPRCTIPPLAAGEYTIQMSTGIQVSDAPSRRLVVSATGGATSCDVPQTGGNPPPLSASDFPQICTVDDDCVIVAEGDQCKPCTCPNAAISKSARESWDGEVRVKQALCSANQGQPSCAPCLANTKPKCGTGGKCQIVTN